LYTYVLTNGLYLGAIPFQGELHPAEHEPIVDPAVWDRVQSMIGDGATTGTRRRSTRAPKAPLAGLLRCVACDAAMTPGYSSKGGRRWRYYLCWKAHRKGWSTCPSPTLPGCVPIFVEKVLG
jgi:site-specific DNA recombinase